MVPQRTGRNSADDQRAGGSIGVPGSALAPDLVIRPGTDATDDLALPPTGAAGGSVRPSAISGFLPASEERARWPPSTSLGSPLRSHLSSSLALAVAISWASMAFHDLYELPISPLALENTGPLAVALLLLAAHLVWPTSRVPLLALLVWGCLNLIGGGVISVLPLPFLPFEPEQTLSHYAAHIVYAVGQLPLVVAVWTALVAVRRVGRA
jgi:hypothetical protein